jgi:short-subunit dehydrogenase
MPGFVETEGFPQRTKLRSRMMRRYVIEAEDVAKAVVDAVEKGKSEVTVPWFPYRFAAIGQALVPGIFSRLVTRRAGGHRDE